ncbi:3',5'-cyclic adenosine monophosphate phosphodiesterase CpdA [mine drainage metagenome]|uniref:3',5'-cyclic adenosine monophosphate phosphodiesterase CpdA n=1 Tax=mine drainage metagenome TaxID=410659 RepID=A0A1J5PYD1_9ZZZZ
MTTLLVQLPDLHIREPGRLAYGRLDTAPYLSLAVDTILRQAQRPDAVVVTGDLTDFGRAGEYAHLRSLLAPLTMPLYLMPGNHDDREQLRRSFPEHAYLGSNGFVQYSVAVGNLQLIALDTVVPAASHGSLCDQRLQWLSDTLDQHRDRPVLIAMHHPPFPTLIGHMDQIGLLQGAVELEKLVAMHPNVERVVCGHLHRSIQVRFGGTLAMTVPSPAHQVCLDLDPNAPSAWALEPPGFALHALSDTRQLSSHNVASGHFDGPHPFHAGGQLID